MPATVTGTYANAASPRQIEFMLGMLAEIYGSREQAESLLAANVARGILCDRARVSRSIDQLIARRDAHRLANRRSNADAKVTTPGIYRRADGSIVRVLVGERSGLPWARLLVVHSPARFDAEGTVIERADIEWTMVPGLIHTLTDDMRLTLEECEALSLSFARCIRCKRNLTVKDSVKRGMGPVCRRKIESGE
jgi:hypothetical protein